MISEVYNIDCNEYIATLPDKFFDLAIVDPPYAHPKFSYGSSRIQKYGDTMKYNKLKPTKNYFKQLKRICTNQIIWGANYYNLPPGQGYIFWYKHQPAPSFADGEMAWTSFDIPAKCFDYPYFGACGSDTVRIHPNQKPIALYLWLLKNYTKPGDKIFDSHMGSQSSRIACHKMGFDFWGCELDKEYFETGCKRFENEIKQGRMF